MQIWTAPSIRGCYKNALPLLGDTNAFTLLAAKGEFVSLQALLRNKSTQKDNLKEDLTKHISGAKVTQTSGAAFDVSSVRVQAQQYVTFNDGITYPDPIANHAEADVLINTTQSMWITFPIPETQSAGEYGFHIAFDCGDEDENAVDVTLKVYDVTIPAPGKGEYLIEHFHTPEEQIILDHAGYNCKAFDDTWWKFMEEFARSLRECRSNVYRIYPLQLLKYAGSRRTSEDKWTFDFSLFDKFCDLLINTGTAKRFAIEDVLTPMDKSEIFLLDYDGNIVTMDISEPVAEIWAKAYFSALYAHILSRSDPRDWIMHIQDEPQYPETWLWARRLARKYMPELRCGNPTCFSGISESLGDDVDLYIPQFFLVEDELDFIERCLAKPGKEVWSYCCCGPRETWYLNRFIDKPAIHSRLIAWATYSRKLSGYLHYGYNWWQDTNQFHPFGVNPAAKYKGDALMIYPSPEDNSYRISNRYINIRDGAQDFELFKIAEKREPEKALALSRSIAVGYKDFDMDEKHFLEARRQLLELAQGL